MVEKAQATNISVHIDRHLHPVRLAIGHLSGVLKANRSSSTVTIDRAFLESVTATLEIFVENFETNFTASEEKKAVETPRVSQTRVS